MLCIASTYHFLIDSFKALCAPRMLGVYFTNHYIFFFFIQGSIQSVLNLCSHTWYHVLSGYFIHGCMFYLCSILTQGSVLCIFV